MHERSACHRCGDASAGCQRASTASFTGRWCRLQCPCTAGCHLCDCARSRSSGARCPFAACVCCRFAGRCATRARAALSDGADVLRPSCANHFSAASRLAGWRSCAKCEGLWCTIWLCYGHCPARFHSRRRGRRPSTSCRTSLHLSNCVDSGVPLRPNVAAPDWHASGSTSRSVAGW